MCKLHYRQQVEGQKSQHAYAADPVTEISH
jgi:hypothetical protein